MIPDSKRMIELYQMMVRIRRFEEKVMDLYARKMIPGILHLYIGQEAVATGVCANLRKDDYVTSTHRGHGHCIAKGGDLCAMMAELFGKSTGYCHGKGGSMHIANISLGILGANAIVGGGLPIAGGAGLSIKMQGTDQVAVCFFGDGACNQGTFHETLNLAAVWKLPVIFVCENNQYSMSGSPGRLAAVQEFYVRKTSYGMEGCRVDGNDVLAVYEGTREAVERARTGGGPTLLECLTYRVRGHSEGELDRTYRYRIKEEIEKWKGKCPIEKLKNLLMEQQAMKIGDFEDLEERVQREVEEALQFALESPEPNPEDALKDVYCENCS